MLELCAQPQEEPWLEFKHNYVHHNEIGEYISAMSNGATISNKPFGYLVWGVEDKTHIVKGTQFIFSTAREGNQDLELWLRHLLSPKISFEIFEFDYQGNHIVLLRIPAAMVEPTCFKKTPYIRIGSHKTELQNYPDYIRQIYNTQIDWSAQLIETAGIQDLDPDAVKKARENYRQKYQNEPFMQNFDSWEDKTFLDKARVTINGKITNTAILLLGKSESIHYILPAVAEITWKLDTEQKAYEHFYPPFLLSTTRVYQKIRNYKVKLFPDNQLFPVEINKYESRIVLEALHNCIAHQDYRLNSRIIVTEKADMLVFENVGNFFEGQPEDYFEGKKTPQHYRNKWLVQAMVSLNMVDSLGCGIHMINTEQRKRYLPLSDYILDDRQKVVLQIYGNIIDEKYSKLLIEKADLPLMKVILLDKVQKKHQLTDEATSLLRKEGLIEGRKPNIFISATLAKLTDKQVLYTKQKPFAKQQLKDWVLKFLIEHQQANRKQIDELLWKLLPEDLATMSRKHKISNLLTEMQKEGLIANKGKKNPPCWVKDVKKVF
ncbi:MAG: RNA-binding domain-containing protein [bacterium]